MTAKSAGGVLIYLAFSSIIFFLRQNSYFKFEGQAHNGIEIEETQTHDRTKMINLKNEKAKRRRASDPGSFKRAHSDSSSSSLQRFKFVSCWIVEKKYYYFHGAG